MLHNRSYQTGDHCEGRVEALSCGAEVSLDVSSGNGGGEFRDSECGGVSGVTGKLIEA